MCTTIFKNASTIVPLTVDQYAYGPAAYGNGPYEPQEQVRMTMVCTMFKSVGYDAP